MYTKLNLKAKNNFVAEGGFLDDKKMLAHTFFSDSSLAFCR